MSDAFRLFKLECVEQILRVENETDMLSALEDIMSSASARSQPRVLQSRNLEESADAPKASTPKKAEAPKNVSVAASQDAQVVLNEQPPKMIRVSGAGDEEMNGVYMLAGRLNSKDYWKKKGACESSIKWTEYDGWTVKARSGRGFYSQEGAGSCPPKSGYTVSQFCNGPGPVLAWSSGKSMPSSAAETKTTPAKRGASSNAYANGSNQNAGNVITDRPSTRVHAPPGGRSQIFFGSDEPAKVAAASPKSAKPTDSVVVKQGTSSNAFASGSNQNAGNVITDRSSTRIHAPPGGVSNIMFG